MAVDLKLGGHLGEVFVVAETLGESLGQICHSVVVARCSIENEYWARGVVLQKGCAGCRIGGQLDRTINSQLYLSKSMIIIRYGLQRYFFETVLYRHNQ